MRRTLLLLPLLLASLLSAAACSTDRAAVPPTDDLAAEATAAESVQLTPTEVPVVAAPTEQDMSPASIPLCADPAFREQAASMSFIFTTLPVAGAMVGPGFPAAGCANVYEGAVQWRLLDSRGNVINDGVTQSSCGTGCVGDFAFNVDFSMPDGIPPTGTLQTFTKSAEDGSERLLNAVPLVFDRLLSAASSGMALGTSSACTEPSFLDQGAGMAFIFTSMPAAGSVVRTGFAVAGCANVDEGNVQWRLQDVSGRELAAGFAQATCGTGCVGSFSFTVDFVPPGEPVPATLELFSTSMADGAEEQLNAIPLIVE